MVGLRVHYYKNLDDQLRRSTQSYHGSTQHYELNSSTQEIFRQLNAVNQWIWQLNQDVFIGAVVRSVG